MKIRTNDMVKIMGGKDKGKTGKVIQVFSDRGLVVVEGLNQLVKHMKPRRQGEKGQKVQFAAPLPASRVALLCKSCGKNTRVGFRLTGETKIRVCKKCGQEVAAGVAST